MGRPALESAGRWVELGLSVETEISGGALAYWYYVGPGGLWWSNVLNLLLPPQRLRPDTRPEHQDPVSHMAQKKREETSLVVKWLRIHLPVHGTRVWALVWEDPTCRGASKPVCRNYWAREPQLLKPVHLEAKLCKREATTMRSSCTATNSSPCSPQLEKACVQQWRLNNEDPMQPKINKYFLNRRKGRKKIEKNKNK